MKAITYTAARAEMASTIDEAGKGRVPVLITQNRDESVVMISLDGW